MRTETRSKAAALLQVCLRNEDLESLSRVSLACHTEPDEVMQDDGEGSVSGELKTVIWICHLISIETGD
jgi:hypothetical protein